MYCSLFCTNPLILRLYVMANSSIFFKYSVSKHLPNSSKNITVLLSNTTKCTAKLSTSHTEHSRSKENFDPYVHFYLNSNILVFLSMKDWQWDHYSNDFKLINIWKLLLRNLFWVIINAEHSRYKENFYPYVHFLYQSKNFSFSFNERLPMTSSQQWL